MNSFSPPTKTGEEWTVREKLLLAETVYRHGVGDWERVSRSLSKERSPNRLWGYFTSQKCAMVCEQQRQFQIKRLSRGAFNRSRHNPTDLIEPGNSRVTVQDTVEELSSSLREARILELQEELYEQREQCNNLTQEVAEAEHSLAIATRPWRLPGYQQLIESAQSPWSENEAETLELLSYNLNSRCFNQLLPHSLRSRPVIVKHIKETDEYAVDEARFRRRGGLSVRQPSSSKLERDTQGRFMPSASASTTVTSLNDTALTIPPSPAAPLPTITISRLSPSGLTEGVTMTTSVVVEGGPEKRKRGRPKGSTRAQMCLRGVSGTAVVETEDIIDSTASTDGTVLGVQPKTEINSQEAETKPELPVSPTVIMSFSQPLANDVEDIKDIKEVIEAGGGVEVKMEGDENKNVDNRDWFPMSNVTPERSRVESGMDVDDSLLEDLNPSISSYTKPLSKVDEVIGVNGSDCLWIKSTAKEGCGLMGEVVSQSKPNIKKVNALLTNIKQEQQDDSTEQELDTKETTELDSDGSKYRLASNGGNSKGTNEEFRSLSSSCDNSMLQDSIHGDTVKATYMSDETVKADSEKDNFTLKLKEDGLEHLDYVMGDGMVTNGATISTTDEKNNIVVPYGKQIALWYDGDDSKFKSENVLNPSESESEYTHKRHLSVTHTQNEKVDQKEISEGRKNKHRKTKRTTSQVSVELKFVAKRLDPFTSTEVLCEKNGKETEVSEDETRSTCNNAKTTGNTVVIECNNDNSDPILIAPRQSIETGVDLSTDSLPEATHPDSIIPSANEEEKEEGRSCTPLKNEWDIPKTMLAEEAEAAKPDKNMKLEVEEEEEVRSCRRTGSRTPSKDIDKGMAKERNVKVQRLGKQHKQKDISKPQKRRSNGSVTTEDEKTTTEAADAAVMRKILLELWAAVRGHRHANMFLRPVLAKHYRSVVYHPIDLVVLRKRIEDGQVKTFPEFKRTVLHMFTNVLMYNRKGLDIYRLTLEMQSDCKEIIELYSQAFKEGRAQAQADEDDREL